MGEVRSTWTDERLDDFKDNVDGRLDELSNRVTDLGRRVDAGFERVDGRIDALQHAMVHAFIAIGAVMLTGFVGLAGLIVTQI
jgi:hypothetical protein